MGTLDKTRETRIQNIETKTGKSFDELRSLIVESGLAKHGEIREMLKSKLELGHGDANALIHYALNTDGQSAAAASGLSTDDTVGEIYAGNKAHLRPIHDRFMAAIEGFGEFESVPKKGYMSLRRKKQFAMIGPATKDRVEVGINMKGVPATSRLAEMPPGGMCQYKVKVTGPDEVDGELIAWVKQAYEGAG
jgi:hypothetical protein